MEEQKPVKGKKKIKLTKYGKILVACLAAAAIIITCAAVKAKKKNDPQSKITPAVEAGKEQITAAEFCYYYYLAYQQATEQSLSSQSISSGTGESSAPAAFDFTKDPAEQTYPFEDEDGKTITWADALKKQAVERAQSTAVFYAEACNEGIMLNHYENETINATIDWFAENAENNGLTLEQYLDYAFGMTEDELRAIMEKEAIASKYSGLLKTELTASATDEELFKVFKSDPYSYSKTTVRCAFFPFPTLTQADGETDDAFEKRNTAESARLLSVVQNIARDISSRKTFDSTAAKYQKKDEETGAVCSVISGCFTMKDLAEATDEAVAHWVCESGRKADQMNVITGEKGIYIAFIVKPLSGEHHSVTVRCCFKAVGELGMIGAKKTANDILKEWKDSKEHSLFSYASMCRDNTDNKQINGDEMIIRAGDTYPAIDDWCFNSERKQGDTAVLDAGDLGCYIVYFASDNTDDLDWKQAAREACGAAKYEKESEKLFAENGSYKLVEHDAKIEKAVSAFTEAVLAGKIVF